MSKLEDTASTLSIGIAIGAYSLCSSTLLLANKMAISYLPVPSVISFIQIAFSTVIIIVLKTCGLITCDSLEWHKVKAYSMYIVAFVFAIYANMQALKESNVETVIVFRACSPIAVSLVEYLFMDRLAPGNRSKLSLALVATGAVFYCTTDSEFALNGFAAYYWVMTYFVLITFEMTYGKKLTNSIKMDSVWGSVFYCNFLAMIPMFMLGWVMGDYEGVGEKLAELPASGAWVLLFSCVAGTLIGYSGWLCREMVSATTYTLVGVVNKFLTILLNVFLWDKHASPMGIVAVCMCLGAGSLYQQSPTRKQVAAAAMQAEGSGPGAQNKASSEKDIEQGGSGQPLLKRGSAN